MHKKATFINGNSIDIKAEPKLIIPQYRIIKPENNTGFSSELEHCAKQLRNLKINELTVFRLIFFIKSKNVSNFKNQIDEITESLTEIYGDKLPPYSIVMEEPCEGYNIICELGYIDDEQINVTYGKKNNYHYSIIETESYNEYCIIGSYSVSEINHTSFAANSSFETMKKRYDALGLSFNNIIRQWNYIGGIIRNKTDQGLTRQNYQVFNEVRSDYYRAFRNLMHYPAATGIGMAHNGVCIDSLAIVPKTNDLKIIPISNPQQQESYEYKQNVLIGDPSYNRNENQAPQFERAILMVLNNSARIYVSGTASIIGQETVGLNDVEKQTYVTIENIEKLISPVNLKEHCPEIKHIPSIYSIIRVYIKQKPDFEKVKAICEKHFPNSPINYVVADICRDNLLVEIECELI